MRRSRQPFTADGLRSMARGRIPGQVIIQYSDKCNATCPQCDMRVQNKAMKRSTLEVDTVRRVIDAAARKGVTAVSFTGGEPFLYQDDVLALIRHAGEAGIKYIRTGTNGFMFRNSHKPVFERRVRELAEALAATDVYTFWISIDSVDPAVHEDMRGLPGVMEGIEKALPIFHEYGVYPSANMGINRNAGGDYRVMLGEPDPASFDARAFYDHFRVGFGRFYQRMVDMGFTIVNMCYPMSVDPDSEAATTAVYSATAMDAIIRFSNEEKLAMFRALYDTVPEYRSKIRIFTPMTSLRALIRQYSGESGGEDAYPCRGGIDFFYVNSADAGTYPCGYRGDEDLGPFWDLDLEGLDTEQTCTECDWECFRDPSELAGPVLDAFRRPIHLARRMAADGEWRRLWLSDVGYYRAASWFCGRVAPDYEALARFGPAGAVERDGGLRQAALL